MLADVMMVVVVRCKRVSTNETLGERRRMIRPAISLPLMFRAILPLTTLRPLVLGSAHFCSLSLHPNTVLSKVMSTTTTVTLPPGLADIDLSGYDAEQSRLMEERCILVDEQDRAYGAVDKKTCML